MVTIIISVHPNCSERTQAIKDKVIEYLGKRMIVNPDDNCPHVVRVNEEIPFPDRKVLAEIAREIEASTTLLAISHDGDNSPVADTYVNLLVG